MSSLNTALYIGTAGMQVSQMGLATVSQNVVNANTPGYSRQVAQTSASSANGFGTGVQLDSISRISDQFLVARTLTATSDASYASTKSTSLTSLEDAFSNSSPDGGLESVIGSFITSLNGLSADPSNSSLRRSAVQQAGITVSALNNASADIKGVATQADSQINSELDNVNQLLKDISTLNTKITELQSTGNGNNSNDLQDARDQKVAALSQDFGIQVTTNTSTGGMRITTEDGRKLVDETGYVQLSRSPAPAGGYGGIVAQNVQQDGTLSAIQLPINVDQFTTGKIKALTDVRDTEVPNLLAQVDQFTQTFMAAVNQISSQGTSSPPASSLTSGNTGSVASTTSDLLTTPGFTSLSGTSINISVTTNAGNVVTTTAGGTPITFAPVSPATTMSLQDMANQINNNPTVGNTALGGNLGVKASVATDGSGKPYLKIESADPANKIVLSNVTGDALGTLGMNNLFTGNSAATISVRSDIATNADLLPVASMRADGGVSTTDGQTITALAKLADTKLNFATAGGLGTQNATAVSYLNTVASNLAVKVSSAGDNATFTSNLQTQAQDLATSVSGVNINEELSNMLIYQNSFQASARIITVVNDMMQTLMNTVQ